MMFVHRYEDVVDARWISYVRLKCGTTVAPFVSDPRMIKTPS